MSTITLSQRSTALLLFAGIVTLVYSMALTLAGGLSRQEGASIIALAMTLDMVLFVGAAYYFLAVRRGGLAPITVVPVLVLSVLAAGRILPPEHQQPLRVLEALAAPLELGLLGWIVWRAGKAFRGMRREANADPLVRFQNAAMELVHNERVAAILASELGALYYGFAAWKARPHVPEGSTPFFQHERSGHAGIVFGFLVILAAEGLAVHILIHQWSALLAWLFTLGTLYGALWLVADYRATVLRPILVTGDRLLLRAGLRFTLSLSRWQIAGISRREPEPGKENVNLTLLGSPTHWITFTEPLTAEGAYGFSRRVRAVGVELDDPAGFDRLLAERKADA